MTCSMRMEEAGLFDGPETCNSEGLVSGHVYSVIGFLEEQLDDEEEGRKPVQLVHLRNPWGSVLGCR